jgi:hypothetical protein
MGPSLRAMDPQCARAAERGIAITDMIACREAAVSPVRCNAVPCGATRSNALPCGANCCPYPGAGLPVLQQTCPPARCNVAVLPALQHGATERRGYPGARSGRTATSVSSAMRRRTSPRLHALRSTCSTPHFDLWLLLIFSLTIPRTCEPGTCELGSLQRSVPSRRLSLALSRALSLCVRVCGGLGSPSRPRRW